MRLRFLLGVLMLLTIAGCGAYTELKPKPKLMPVEGGYIELARSKNEKKTNWFLLKKKKKYFMRFPAPQSGNLYLVLRTDQKVLLNTYFTGTFSKGKRSDPRVKDESQNPNEFAYPVDRAIPLSFWVIGAVNEDMPVKLEYRYVPIWRYTFEYKHAVFTDRLARNRIDRNTYNTLGTSFHFTNFDFARETNTLAGTIKSLKSLQTELKDLQTLFPAELLNSADVAYQDFVDLRDKLQDEITFQENYQDVLTVFRTESDTKKDIIAFLNAAPTNNAFLGQTTRFPPAILTEARAVLGKRLGDVVSSVDQELTRKSDVSPIRFSFDLAEVGALYTSCGQTPPQAFKDFVSIISAYNAEAGRLEPAQTELVQALRYSGSQFTWPSDTHYDEALKHIANLNRVMPEQRSASFQKYDRYRCVALLNTEVSRIRSATVQWGRDFAAAQGVVQQVNALRPQQAFRTIIQTLSGYRRLDFLLKQYPDVDQLSLDQQQTAAAAALESRLWPLAEQNLRALHTDEMFLQLDRIASVKRAAVERLEGQLGSGIEEASKSRVDLFVASNKLAIDNVEALYVDSVFTPVYVMAFTSGSTEQLRKRNADVQSYLDNLKYNGFPSSAIPELYREFVRSPRDRGVERARAIVVHGKYYRGDDRQVKNLVSECDPNTAKWITKPTEYRKVFVLPVTNNPKGDNKYLFRLNVRIPSDAKFPVFDVNIKLPKEIAGKATLKQWYDYIKLNKEDLKAQGRFTITAPTAANNYEAQLTPVQMQANDNNVLEVQFTYPGFQVFEVSAMSQRPLLRKD